MESIEAAICVIRISVRIVALESEKKLYGTGVVLDWFFYVHSPPLYTFYVHSLPDLLPL